MDGDAAAARRAEKEARVNLVRPYLTRLKLSLAGLVAAAMVGAIVFDLAFMGANVDQPEARLLNPSSLWSNYVAAFLFGLIVCLPIALLLERWLTWWMYPLLAAAAIVAVSPAAHFKAHGEFPAAILAALVAGLVFAAFLAPLRRTEAVGRKA